LCHGRIQWTIFRPTLIYGGGLDGNVTAIADFIHRFGFFPVAGEGRGRRQPVHADDLADACVKALECRPAFGRAYDLVGGTTLEYRAMVEAVARGIGREPRIVRLPPSLLRLMAGRGRREIVRRMAEDLAFDSTEAVRDFGYSPR